MSIFIYHLNEASVKPVHKTAAGGMSFFLAMILNPMAQRRAQEEIDRVVGPSRLPGFEDRPHLPYVTALMKEVIRFHAPAASGLCCPLWFFDVFLTCISFTGIPHKLSKHDIYQGYHIPAGSLVVANIE